MMIPSDSAVVLVQLLLAHMVVDFFVQPRSWVEDRWANRWRSRKLYCHALLAGIVPFIFLGRLENWPIVPAFVVTHLLIDGIRTRYDDNTRALIADQALHLAVIVIVWLFAFNTSASFDEMMSLLSEVWNDPRTALALLGAGMLTIPSSILIGKLMKRWAPADGGDDTREHTGKEVSRQGLEDAGRYIGIAERLMIFVLVLAGQFTVIGFVIATKSIFRLREGSERAEYYLVGSMLSFSIAITVSLAVRYIIGWA